MTNDKIIEHLGYIKVLVAREGGNPAKIEALDNAVDIVSGLDDLVTDIQTYEADCQLTADGHCSKCNETLFKSIYYMLEKNFGAIDVWHKSEKV